MKDIQIACLLKELHQVKQNDISKSINEKLNYFNLDQNQKNYYLNEILNKYENGIKNLNRDQLSNILAKINSSKIDKEVIISRLKFYEIDRIYYEEILDFFNNLLISNKVVDVKEIDLDFKGVQVASRDDFNMIINQGYTGDWVLTPNSVVHKFVQVASMNETGLFPRGYYLNAEISKIEPYAHGDQTRHRIFIKNPVILDSGNRNVKFNMNPVNYIN